MLIGYSSASNLDKNDNAQKELLTEYGCEKVYIDKFPKRKTTRPQLRKMLGNLQPGDVVVVIEVTRIAKGNRDLYEIIELVHSKGADIKSLKEKWFDTSSGNCCTLVDFCAGMTRFGRELLSYKIRQGVSVANAKGRELGRPKSSQEKKDVVINMYQSDMDLKTIIDLSGVSKPTIYRWLKEANIDYKNK